MQGRDLLRTAYVQARLRFKNPAEYRAYLRHRDDSMIRRSRFIGNLHLVRFVGIDGDIVECGTWQGGMSAAMAEVLPGRRSVLFDSFQGLPDTSERDGEREHRYMATSDPLVASEDRARAAMQRAGSTNFSIRPGWFSDTVPKYATEQPTIAVLRLDGDWYDSTMVCLEHLYPLVPLGGVVLIDDYGTWDGCTRAVHDYLSRCESTDTIWGTPATGTYIRKAPSTRSA